MLVGRYKLIAPAGGGPRRRTPRALGLALAFEDAPELQYVDDKRMGKVYVARAADEEQIPVYGKLGVDLLSPAFTRDGVRDARSRKRRDQVRTFLMDKAALASIGNAYADEILFAARIHPKTFCRKLAPAEVDALYEAIRRVLAEAIAEIRRATSRPRSRCATFSRCAAATASPARVCGTTIRAVRVGDGDACFCPRCQPDDAQALRRLSGPGCRPATRSVELSAPRSTRSDASA